MFSMPVYYILSIFIVLFAGLLSWLVYYRYTNSIPYLKVKGKVANLVSILESEPKESRHRQVIRALAEIDNIQAIEALVYAQGLPCKDLAKEALEEIGPRAVPTLISLLSNRNRRAAAAEALVAVGEAAEMDLQALLLDRSQELRHTAALILDNIGWKPKKNEIGAAYWLTKRQWKACVEIGAPALNILIRSLEDPTLCAPAAAILAAIGDARAVKPLLDFSMRNRFHHVAVDALVRMFQVAQPILCSALNDPDEQIRKTALEVLKTVKWKPERDEIGAAYWAAQKEWEKCAACGAPAVRYLEGALQDPGQDVRAAAATAMGEVNRTEAVNALVEAMQDTSLRVRRAAVQSLGKIGSDRAITALAERLKDPPIQEAVAEALALIGKPAIDVLVKALQDPDWAVRRSAGAALEKLGWDAEQGQSNIYYLMIQGQWERCVSMGEAAVDPLIAALDEQRYRQEAATALGNIGAERAALPLIQVLKVETSHPVQRSIARALEKIGAPAVVPLMDAVREKSVNADAAILTLGLMGDKRSIKLLVDILSDHSWGWSCRKAAALALGELGIESLAPMLELLRRKGVEPRGALLVGVGMGKIGRPATDGLLQAMEKGDTDILAMLVALGIIADPKALGALMAVLQDHSYGTEIRRAAVWALAKLGPPAIAPLINALNSAKFDRDDVQLALLRIGNPAVEPLLSSLPYSSSEKRERIIKLLGEIGNTRAINPLVSLLQDRSVSKLTVNAALDLLWKAKQTGFPPPPDRVMRSLDDYDDAAGWLAEGITIS